MNTHSSAGPLRSDPETTRGIVKWAVMGFFSKLFLAAVLLISAGRWDWRMGWVYVGIFVTFDVATALVLIPRSPGLLIERSQIGPGTKDWDKVLLRLAAGYFPMAACIVAGLDVRYGWSAQFPSWLQIGAAAIVALGYAVVLWAMAANAFFSATVRIQTERGHTVATGGPYRFVRHPGYVGALLYSFAVPLMLGSWWALIPSALSAAAYVVRTALEDKTLHDELDGYREYARRVRYRLLPGVW